MEHQSILTALLIAATVLLAIRRYLVRRWRGAESIPGEVQPLPPPDPTPKVIITRDAGPLVALLAVGLVLLSACQSFAQLAELARRTYDAASDAEERSPDLDTKAKARGCGKAARDAVRAADAAQQALVDKAPGYDALKGAADTAEARMKAACRPLRLDVTTGPAPNLAAPRPADLRPAAAPAAPDMGSVPAADLAPRPLPDGGR